MQSLSAFIYTVNPQKNHASPCCVINTLYHLSPNSNRLPRVSSRYFILLEGLNRCDSLPSLRVHGNVFILQTEVTLLIFPCNQQKYSLLPKLRVSPTYQVFLFLFQVDGLAALILCAGVVVAAGNEPFKLGNYGFHRIGQVTQAMLTDAGSGLQPQTREWSHESKWFCKISM